jgi:hypothetical protein
VLKRREEVINFALIHTPLRKQDSQPRILNCNGARSLLHLHRGFDALFLVLV